MAALAHADVRQSVEAITDEPDPATLPPRVSVLTTHSASGSQHHVYVLGTAHISSESAEDVKKLIRAVKPQVVMVELCRARRPVLTMPDKIEVPTMQQMMHSIRIQRLPMWQVLYSWLLAKFADEAGVAVGSEFRAAAVEAQAVQAAVCLGDRPINVTVARVWAALSAWQKVKFMFMMLHSGVCMPDSEELRRMVEDMKETDVITEALLELAKEFPSLTKPLITERDQYMVSVLRTLAADSARVVAVVGAGHLAGIRDHWEADIDIEEIQRLPLKRRSWRPYIIAITGLSVGTVVALRWRRSALR